MFPALQVNARALPLRQIETVEAAD